MPGTVLQLRIGATRDRGFLFRACARPPASISIGRNRESMLPLTDPEAPELHVLFSVGSNSCLLDFRTEWGLLVYRDEKPISGADLLAEGTAFRRGRRQLLQMGIGTRGALRIGNTRLLFKWEEVPETPVGDVPLKDVGVVPRCHACGQALRDALPREGLFARCDACRAVNRFVDPDSFYREETQQGLGSPPRGTASAAGSGGGAAGAARLAEGAGDSQKIPTVTEEADTLLGVPIFAPVTGLAMEALPDLQRPAGIAGRMDTPPDLRAARQPLRALENMQTVLGRSPWLGPRTGRVPKTRVEDEARAVEPTPEPAPSGDPPGVSEASAEPPPPPPAVAPPPAAPAPAAHDDAFYKSELEALLPPKTIPGNLVDPLHPSVPWRTMSVLSARAEFETASGRIPRSTVDEMSAAGLRALRWRRRIEANAPWILAIGGLALLGIGVVSLWDVWRRGDGLGAGDAPATSTSTSTATATATATGGSGSGASNMDLGLDGEKGRDERVRHEAGTYVKLLPGDPTPVPIFVGAFEIDRREVRAADFGRFLAETGRDAPAAWAESRPPPSPDLPVWGVSLEDARAYCRWNGARLPSENEWERAAAGEFGLSYPWGHSWQASRVAAGTLPEPVGAHPDGASPSGVLDLVGNVPEWVEQESSDNSGTYLKGGGASPWNRREWLQVFVRVPSEAAPWKPGPGFRCASSSSSPTSAAQPRDRTAP